MNSHFSYPFMDPSHQGKGTWGSQIHPFFSFLVHSRKFTCKSIVPYVPKKRGQRLLPPIGIDVKEGIFEEQSLFEDHHRRKDTRHIGTKTMESIEHLISERNQALFSFDVNEIASYDVHNMRRPTALGEMSRNRKLMEVNAPSRKKSMLKDDGKLSTTQVEEIDINGSHQQIPSSSSSSEEQKSTIDIQTPKSVLFRPQLSSSRKTNRRASKEFSPVHGGQRRSRRSFQSLSRKSITGSLDVSPLAAISSRLPYLKDIILGEAPTSSSFIQESSMLIQPEVCFLWVWPTQWLFISSFADITNHHHNNNHNTFSNSPLK